MNSSFFQSLGGIDRFLEVERDPNSRPRDKLLARRTWWHRELSNYTEFIHKNHMDSKLSMEDIQIIDQVINKLNELRVAQSLDIDLIETLFLNIKSFLK